MSLLELTVVILVLISLVTIIFVGAQAWKKGTDRSGCVINIRNAQQAVRAYQNMYEVPEYTTIDMYTDLMGPGKFLDSEPRCPAGGSYGHLTYIPPQGTLVMSCSLASSERHSLQAATDW